MVSDFPISFFMVFWPWQCCFHKCFSKQLNCLSSSSPWIYFLFILLSGLTVTCTLNDILAKVILQIFFSIFVFFKLFSLWDESANVSSGEATILRCGGLFKHDIRLIEGFIEIIILHQAMHFRELTMHSCLRNLRSETSVGYFANAIEHYINLRKLDISLLKCTHNVPFTKDMLHLRGICIDKCQNNSPDRAL